MCCFMHEAYVPETTKIFAGAVNHPTHGLIHVVGYSNKIRNRHRGPNCMILAIPSKDDMGEENFLDPKKTKNVLWAMSHAVFPPPPVSRDFDDHNIVIGASSSRGVQHIISGDYDILLAEDPSEIPSKLSEIPESKRPEINQDMFDWWRENATGMHVALVCFNGNVEPDDFFYWYKPLEGHEKNLRHPALDSHSGKPPTIGELVRVDHELFVSWPEIEGVEVNYLSPLSSEIKEFIPNIVAGVHVGDQWPNGDFGIEIGTTLRGNRIPVVDVKRLSLPGSKVRL